MKIGIIGLGLMGGSIAKSLKYKDKTIEIVAFDTNEEDLKIALNENIIDSYSLDINESFSNLNYIFICVPVKYTLDIAKKLEKIVSSDCIVTDIGSTKGSIVPEIEKLNLNYVGTHPMVGKEKSGFSYADSHLYDNMYFIITTTEKTKSENIDKIITIIKLLNAKPYVIPLNKHDFIVSVISHVPHIIAFSLVNMTNELEDENNHLRTLAAGGFKDITRIASSNPIMWQNICLENSDEILNTINSFKISLEKIESYIINKNEDKLFSFIENSKNFRDSIDNIQKDNEICMKITNTPGELEKVISILARNDINIINLSIQDDIDEKHGTLKLYFKNIDYKEKALNILKNENMI